MTPSEIISMVGCPSCGAAVGSECRGAAETGFATHEGRARRAREERDFWVWVDERLADPACSLTEQELLDTIALPGWAGRKARQKPAIKGPESPGENVARPDVTHVAAVRTPWWLD